MTTSLRRTRRGAALAAAALTLLAGPVLAACGDESATGSPPAKTPASSQAQQAAPQTDLSTYKGKGFTVGYPKDWQQLSGHTVVKGAAFEVGVKSPDGRSMESSFDVILEEAYPWPLRRVASDFVDFSRSIPGFRLLGNTQVEMGGQEAWEVRKAYRTAEGLDLRQVDWFVRTKDRRVVDIRMIFRAERYDAAQPLVTAVRSSFRPAS